MKITETSVDKVIINVERMRGKGYRASCLIHLNNGTTQGMEKIYRNRTLMQVHNDLHRLKQEFLERGLREDQVDVVKPIS